MAKPAHKHDCENCQFLGTWSPPDSLDDRVYDLYICQPGAESNELDSTLVARWSSDVSDYASGIEQGIQTPVQRKNLSSTRAALRVAYRLACDYGCFKSGVEKDPKWRQDTPRQQLTAALMAVKGNIYNAKDSRELAQKALDQALAFLDEDVSKLEHWMKETW